MSQYTGVSLFLDGIDPPSNERFEHDFAMDSAALSSLAGFHTTVSDFGCDVLPDSYNHPASSLLLNCELRPFTENMPEQGFGAFFGQPVIPNTIDPGQLQFWLEATHTYSNQPVYPYPNVLQAYISPHPSYATSNAIPTYPTMDFSTPELLSSTSSARSSSSSLHSSQNTVYRLPTPPPAPQQFSSLLPTRVPTYPTTDFSTPELFSSTSSAWSSSSSLYSPQNTVYRLPLPPTPPPAPQQSSSPLPTRIPTYPTMDFSTPELLSSTSSACSSPSSLPSPQNTVDRLPSPPTLPPAPQQFSSPLPTTMSFATSPDFRPGRSSRNRERTLRNSQYPGLYRPLGGSFVCLAPGCTKTFGTDLSEVHIHYKNVHYRRPCNALRKCPFPDCKQVNRGFGDLTRHLYSKGHGEAVFYCPEGCDKMSTRRDALKRHLIKAHGCEKGQAKDKCTEVERALGIEQDSLMA
ncbi:zinc finger transcription factor ace1 [Moniliophthora roreri MCA 2997]|uniref:Zinc finger transcription factor ace1 n=1 Tax=Moniliophthora roreri (strain MCA 2997) TaxID=1381753 RepID=V2WF96_MONRO|nr:zinc finger transcription factor ace1 [Moniliophthora roreri MCA 2997]